MAYWEKYIASLILNNVEITDEILKTAYTFFKEDNDLIKKENERPDIKLDERVVNKEDSDFTLKEIHSIKNVNALKNDQIIPIGESLTLIYGENGVGKSGYIRLLNKVFKSRGDKNIIPNIYAVAAAVSPPSCVFKFIRDTTEYEIPYPEQADDSEFNMFSVFDSSCAQAHLNQEDELRFTPNSFSFFDKFIHTLESIGSMLSTEISSKKIANPFNLYFEKETSTKIAITNLSANTKIAEIRKIAEISEKEKEQNDKDIKELDILKTIDVQKKADEIRKIKSLLSGLNEKISKINTQFTTEIFESLELRILNHKQNVKLSQAEGVEQFKSNDLKSIGSDEWKNFIKSAEVYSRLQNTNNSIYPSDKDICLLCKQPLNKEATKLIQTYWAFLSSKAENELKISNKDITNLINQYKQIDFELVNRDTVLGEWLKDNHEDILLSIESNLLSLKELCSLLIFSMESLEWNSKIKSISIDGSFIQQLDKLLSDKLLSLNVEKINERKELLEKSNNEYLDRCKLVPLLNQIEQYINTSKWVKKAESKQFTTRKITSKQKEIFIKYVTDDYIHTFNKECDILKANFKVEIQQRGSKGATLKKLSLKGQTPSKVLSEGEQRAIALADFLSEAQIGDCVKGIFFDDPVNSLDHKRRYIIAKRIVEESKERQIIVFTHDISFFMSLQTIAFEDKVDCIYTTIRKIANTPGVIISELPWPAMNVKERISKLKQKLQSLNPVEKSGNVDEYYYLAKAWCGLLRETWERCVEEKLFNDAIQRFNPAIQTQRLKKAPFTIDLYEEIEKGMGDCSNWVHDQARAINQDAPNTTELNVFLNSFETFVKQFK